MLSSDPDGKSATWWLDLGDGREVHKTVYYATEELIDLNAERANASIGKRWGDGQVAASIPLNVYFDQLAEAQRQKDTAYIKRWLNDPDHAKFRTFRGRV